MTRKLGLSSDWISARFRDERSRLEMTHAKVAQICGVSRNTVMAWEKETSIPADGLAKLYPHGFDPHYIITGVRCPNPEAALREEVPPNPEEWKVLREFRALSDLQREQARAMIQVLKAGMTVGGGTVVVGDGARTAGRDFIQGGTINKSTKQR